MQFVNDPRPWNDGHERSLTMADLVANDTIPADAAAMLWWAMEQGASLLTAGGPSGAGKSTLAKACLHFLPEGAQAYAVSGPDDRLLVPIGNSPTYLLVSELSRHGLPTYIWGPAARRAFALLRDGLRLVGTLHADSVDEAIEALTGEVELPREDVPLVDLVAVTRVDGWTAADGRRWTGRLRAGDDSVRRRIVEIGLLEPDQGRGARKIELAALDTRSGRLEIADPPAGMTALARWAGVPTSAVAAAIAERADVLSRLATTGLRDARYVDDAVRLVRAA